jgi:hypothetical protein
MKHHAIYECEVTYMSPYLQTVPLCQNLYRNSFTYHCLQEDKTLQFDDAIHFLGRHATLFHYLLKSLVNLLLCKIIHT